MSVARAIVNKPKVLIADEPTRNLDPQTSDEIVDILERINASGTTVIMATHNKDIVNERQHRLLEIAGGRLVRDEEGGTYGNED